MKRLKPKKLAIALTFLIAGAVLLYIKITDEKKFFDFSKDHLSSETPAPGTYRLLALHNNGTAEKELAQRLQLVADRLGWKVYSCGRPSKRQKSIGCSVEKVIEHIAPDALINLEATLPHYPEQLHLCTIFDPLCLLNDQKMKDFFGFRPGQPFDGYLITSEKAASCFKDQLTNQDKTFKAIPWHPSVQKTTYSPVENFKLFYCGSLWDAQRRQQSYQQLYYKLDQHQLLDVYGPSHPWKHLDYSYHGRIPHDGTAILQALHDSGIALVLHTNWHLDEGVPSGRIFEAIAASCIVISDRNPFIQKHFGDNVLYIDVNSTGEEMFEQVNAHVQWVRSNPDQARNLAKKCHDIFLEKFTLEHQFEQLGHLLDELAHSKVDNHVTG